MCYIINIYVNIIMSSCKDDNTNLDDNFTRFAKTLLKSFVLVTSILFLIVLKKQNLTDNATLFNFALFIVLSTVIFSIIGLIDSYLFNNIAIGMGIAIGTTIMKF
uniref:Uncharacterized protein n=1 Tax=viral metagenome TaxID=1070528 RepID=A0A6C0J0Q3_9ZZZZ